MDKFIVLCLFVVHLLVMHSLKVVVHGATIITSCSQTPYPEICNHFSSTTNYSTLTFRDIALKATMNQAEEAHRLLTEMDLSSFNDQAKLAWADCLELYEDTVNKLNNTCLGSSIMNEASKDDTQTWLSAALANQQTCQNGFIDFDLSSHLKSLSPLVLSNLSKLLSNSLAINKASFFTSSPKQVGGRRLLSNSGFPTWISAADRKLLQSSSSEGVTKADMVVAQDGSGNYKTISEAVAASVKLRSTGTNNRFVIHVKSGVYDENVEIKRSMKNLMFIGDGIDATVVTGSMNVQDGSTTFRSATFGVSGNGFIAQDMTFENTAGPQKHQAVALRSGSDFSIFYKCSFKGYQDTLYVYSQRQFYRDCHIYGTIDFIFGDAAAILQNCDIYVRKPMNNQQNTVTSQARTDPNENTGIIVHNSRVTASSEFRSVQGSFKTYLGRPWRKYSRTVFMKCSLDGLIDGSGWLAWSGDFALSTLYYGEYMNTGGGATTSRRVEWPGYHVITSEAEAAKFTAGNFLDGDTWIPASGVPYASGL